MYRETFETISKSFSKPSVASYTRSYDQNSTGGNDKTSRLQPSSVWAYAGVRAGAPVLHEFYRKLGYLELREIAERNPVRTKVTFFA